MAYRLYSFVANLYLSPLQHGLQTAHVVSELARSYRSGKEHEIFLEWATRDKTIIICGAGNHGGVIDCFTKLSQSNVFGLPMAVFREDEMSMNGMATACGVIVPENFYDAKLVPDEKMFEHIDENFMCTLYKEGTKEYDFITHIKSFRLA